MVGETRAEVVTTAGGSVVVAGEASKSIVGDGAEAGEVRFELDDHRPRYGYRGSEGGVCWSSEPLHVTAPEIFDPS